MCVSRLSASDGDTIEEKTWGDGAKLGPCEPDGLRLVLGDRGGDVVAEGGQQVGARLEAVLVQVVVRRAAGAEDELALEIRVLADGCRKLVPLHGRAARRTSRACATRRAASEPAPWSEVSEPSAK